MGSGESDEAAIFDELVQASTVAERETLLDLRCGQNLSLRRRIESLLNAYFDSEFLESLPAEILALGRSETGLSGRQIGTFHILEQIGQGGMGDVYLARSQHEPTRFVALKVIKTGMDTRQVIARFNLERSILQRLDHPNIANYVDSDIAESGRAFFAMELVQGMAVTEYCDRNRLSIEDRLRLFLDICSAVEYAHTLGIVHRDLKPQNMLVLRRDGQAIAKVIDFGIAKALTATASDGSRLTGGIQWLGTPHYMSPEQMSWSADVDARADVYSLGVVLYELLTGTTPMQSGAAEDWDFQRCREWFMGEEVQLPSRRIASIAVDSDPDLYAARGIDPRQLARRVRGELDWIASKAIARDREHRYASARELAGDIRAHLEHRPVTAQAPSAIVRLRKWTKRNSQAVSIATGLILATGLLGSLFWFAGTIRRAHEARQSVESDLIHSEFLRDIRAAHEFLGSGDSTSARKLLEKYSEPSGHPYANHFLTGYLRGLVPEPRQTFLGHQHDILEVDLSPDGRWIASGDRGGDILIWDRQTGRLIRRLQAADKEVTRVRFCPNGKLLATAGQDKLVRLWNAADWTSAGELSQHESTINGLDWSPDGSLIASGDRGGVVCVWNAATRTLVQSLPPHAQAVRCLEWSPDGQYLVTADGELGVHVWETVSWSEKAFFGASGTLSIAFSADSHLLAFGGYPGELSIIALDALEVVARCKARIQIWSVSFDGSQELLISGSHGIVQLFRSTGNTQNWESVHIWQSNATVSNLRSIKILGADRAGEHLLLAASQQRRIDVVPKSAICGYGSLARETAPIGTIAGKSLLCLDDNHHTFVEDLVDGTSRELPLDGQSGVHPIFSVKRNLAAVAGIDGNIRIFRADTWEEIVSLEFPYSLWMMSFSRDGNQLALAGGLGPVGKSGSLRIWDVRDWTFREATYADCEVAAGAIFSPTEDLLLVGCIGSNNLTCLHANSLEILRTVEIADWHRLMFDPTGEFLVVGQRGRFSVWKGDLSEELWTGIISFSNTHVEAMSISAGHQIMAMLLKNGVVEFWD